MAAQANDLTWLLTDFVKRTTGAVSALVTSRDGIQVASLNHDRDGEADTLSAITSGLQSLADGAGRLLKGAGGVRQVAIELGGGHLFVMAAGYGALLTVLVDTDGDVGQVSYEMTLLIKQVSHYLSVAPRSEPAAAGATVQ